MKQNGISHKSIRREGGETGERKRERERERERERGRNSKAKSNVKI
jgi:hypothetical protein